MALRLLDEYESADAEWVSNVREKIDAAILASEQTPPVDGETFVNQVLERFSHMRQQSTLLPAKISTILPTILQQPALKLESAFSENLTASVSN